MPALGMNQETGTLLRWLKAEGDAVKKGEPLMEVATDKTDVEIEANADGILGNVSAQEGDEVPVGEVIAQILAPGEKPQPKPQADSGAETATSPTPDAAKAGAADAGASKPAGGDQNGGDQNGGAASTGGTHPISPVAARVAAEHGVDVSRIQPAGSRIQKEDVLAYVAAQSAGSAGQNGGQDSGSAGGRVLASPKARRLAQEASLDLATLRGSGPEGAVLAADVESAVAATIEAPAAAAASASVAQEEAGAQTTIPMSRMWKVMAQRLTESWTTVPHFYLTREVECTRLIAWRKDLVERSPTKITYSDLLVKLTAAALRAHPRVNAAWHDGDIVENRDIHVGLAVAVEDGLLVPVLRHADRLRLGEMAQQRATLVQAAQSGKLALEDLQGGTFTISNLGMFGVDQFNAIVNPPQAGILAVGRMAEKVVPVEGAPAVRTMMTLTLSCDHRIVDGARAAQFLDTLAAYLEEPLRALE